MTVYTLIERHNHNNPGSHFFDRDTLRFFGERISEMRVYKDTEIITDYSGNNHICYVLSSLQRKAPGGPSRAYHYFDSETYEVINGPDT